MLSYCIALSLHHPETHLLPPTCLLLLHVTAAVSYYFCKGYCLLPGEEKFTVKDLLVQS